MCAPHSFAVHSQSKTLVSADGTKIYANCVGDPSKPAVIFIHGFCFSSVVFEPIFIDPEWVRYDVRGHGRSGNATDQAAWESKRLAEDFEAVVQGLNLVKPFIAGWTLGVTHITDILSFHAPSYLSGIIMIAPVTHTDYESLTKVGTAATLSFLPSLTQSVDVNAYHDAGKAFVSLCSDDFPYLLRQACLGSVLSQSPNVTTLLLSRFQDKTDLSNTGKNSNLPLLVLYGDQDKVVKGDVTVHSLEDWRNLKVVIFERGDHVPWLGHAGAFRRELLHWVDLFTNK
ncbi:Alpha/Beta hydrolase protein [Crucibulum laeve]|uniref:Alpha/Beta hydrolase protein n=1 Tax=Crucibulum laeve TaxID=68775 RepID=A0A5C3LZF7_9AGAR|nr:Alpha/Beta hydrolase protein [Crucibulum laeve]